MPDRAVYLTSEFADLERRQDLVFHTVLNHAGAREDLRLDATLPAGDARQGRRAILWIHGGGFRPGCDRRQSYVVRMADEFARRGYVCFSCDYRVRETPLEDLSGTVRDAVGDCRAALAWMRANAVSYGIDAERAVLGGGSAGGMTAVNLCALAAIRGHAVDLPAIAALVNLWGSPAASDLLAAPSAGFPPTITVHGTADALVPYGNSVALNETLQRRGVRHELVTIEGAPHTPVAHLESFSAAIARFLVEVWPGNPSGDAS